MGRQKAPRACISDRSRPVTQPVPFKPSASGGCSVAVIVSRSACWQRAAVLPGSAPLRPAPSAVPGAPVLPSWQAAATTRSWARARGPRLSPSVPPAAAVAAARRWRPALCCCRCAGGAACRHVAQSLMVAVHLVGYMAVTAQAVAFAAQAVSVCTAAKSPSSPCLKPCSPPCPRAFCSLAWSPTRCAPSCRCLTCRCSSAHPTRRRQRCSACAPPWPPACSSRRRWWCGVSKPRRRLS